MMTGGQTDLSLDAIAGDQHVGSDFETIDYSTLVLPLLQPNSEESQNHVEWLSRLDDKVDGQCVWSRLNEKQKNN